MSAIKFEAVELFCSSDVLIAVAVVVVIMTHPVLNLCTKAAVKLIPWPLCVVSLYMAVTPPIIVLIIDLDCLLHLR